MVAVVVSADMRFFNRPSLDKTRVVKIAPLLHHCRFPLDCYCPIIKNVGTEFNVRIFIYVLDLRINYFTCSVGCVIPQKTDLWIRICRFSVEIVFTEFCPP